MNRWIALLLLVFLSGNSLLAEDKPAENSSIEPAPLVLWQREIAVFRGPIATLSPTVRRDTALRRLQELPDIALYDEVKSQMIEVGDLKGVSFLCGDRLLFTLIEADVDAASGETLEILGESVRKNLEELRLARLDQRNWSINLKGIGVSLAATLILAALLGGLRKLSRTVRRFFVRTTSKLSKLKQRDLDLRPAFLQLSRRLTGLLFSSIGLGVIYIWFTVVLGQFPYTAPWATVLGDHVAKLGHHFLGSALSSIPNVLIVVAIFFLTRGTSRITDQILRSFEGENESEHVFAKDTARATRRIASVLIWIFGLVIAYPYIPGSDSDAFKGVGVLLGLMISLGSTGLVNQLMSGFVVLYSGAIRTGEYARVGDVEGTIADIGLLSTKVLTPKNEYVTVPNAVLIAKETLNYSRMTENRTELSTSVTIGYDTPWRQVHELLLLAVDRTPGIRDKPEPRVVQTALSDFYVAYELRFVPADITRKGAVLSDLHERIQDAFAESGVQIMSPNFVAQPKEPVLPKRLSEE
ncbi:mechanosensitive ion channel family protein [Haloferula sp.]|uniref:mechanosensitive ion channel family protein n=1 Tax=Haloferula sp. TaxID=2497595 RepID=UPI003C72B9BF